MAHVFSNAIGSSSSRAKAFVLSVRGLDRYDVPGLIDALLRTFIACTIPVIVPIVSVILVLEAMADWRWHLLFSAPLLVAFGAFIFYRTTSSAVYVRALALMNIGFAADLLIDMFFFRPNNGYMLEYFPLAALLPMSWCLVMWFRQRTGSSVRAKGHAAIFSLTKTAEAMLILMLPILFSVAYYSDWAGDEASENRVDNIAVIQGLRGVVPVYQINERKFLRYLIKDRYLWYDAERLNRVTNSTPLDSILELAKGPLDKWSYINSAGESIADIAGRRHGLGITRIDGGLVLKVEPASPAAQAGLRRGDTVLSIDGIPLPEYRHHKRKSQDTAAVINAVHKNSEMETLEISRETYVAQRVGAPKVIDVSGHKVGYLAYDEFRESAREPLANAMTTLRNEHITEIVLDLRYNSGGSVDDVELLAGMLAPPDAQGKLASRTTGNRNLKSLGEDRLIAQGEPKPMSSPKRIFVITSSETCSASEALIMALRAYMPVVLIGSTTCGKPFGMEVQQYGGKVYSLITFAIENARGVGGYTAGIPPTCEAPDDPRFELGDAREESLAEAIYYIEHGQCSNVASVETGAQG